MSFFKSYDALDSIEKEIQERQATFDKPFRFFMKENEEGNVIFLTDDPPIIEEHNLKLNGKWGNTFTCLKNLGQQCPLCDAGDRPYTVGFYLVIDRRPYKSKKTGKVYKDTLKVLATKFSGLKLLKKFSKKYEGLEGIEFEVSRTSAKAPNTGDVYTKEAKHDADDVKQILQGKTVLELLNKDSLKDFWESYLEPVPAADLAAKVSAKASGKDFDAEEETDYDN